VSFVIVSVKSIFSLSLTAVHFHFPLFYEKILILPGVWVIFNMEIHANYLVLTVTGYKQTFADFSL